MIDRSGTVRLRHVALVAGACVLVACSASDSASDDSDPGPSSPSTASATTDVADVVDTSAEARSGGDATVFVAGRNAFGQPIDTLTREERRAFAVGNNFFNDNWVTAPASTEGRDGLGPLFNAQSCSSCHEFDGRGAPPMAADDPERGLAPPPLGRRAGRHRWARPGVRRPAAGPCDQRRAARRPHRDRADRGRRHVRGRDAVHVARPHVHGRGPRVRPARRRDHGLAAHRAGGVRCRPARGRPRRRVARARRSRRRGRRRHLRTREPRARPVGRRRSSDGSDGRPTSRPSSSRRPARSMATSGSPASCTPNRTAPTPSPSARPRSTAASPSSTMPSSSV